jgi:membrane-associated phospholipid phosphatase
MRDLGGVEALADLPDWIEALLAVLTILGDPLAVLLIAAVVYWVGEDVGIMDRRSGARLATATLVGIAAIPGTKAILARPRPPADLWAVSVEGYAMPSGHATAIATIAVAGVLLSERGRHRDRWLVAAGVVLIVSLTRIGLGVHYLGDVLAGAALGSVCAVVTVEATRRRVRPGLGIALLMGVFAAVVTGLSPGNPMTTDAALALGGTAGVALAWTGLDGVGAGIERPTPVVILLGSATALVGLWVAHTGGSVSLTVLGGGVIGATLAAVPRVEAIP